MNRYKRTIAIFSGLVMLLSLSIVASAQRNNRRSNDDYYGNNRNNVNISYAVKSLKNSSRNFEKALDRELDRSRYDGTDREDRLNNLAKDFSKAADDLEDDYSRRNQRKSDDEARKVLQLGSQLDRALTRSRIVQNNYSLQNSWNMIERDLITIARAYNYNYNGSYGRNRGRNDRNDRNDRYNRNLRSTIVNLRNNARSLENRLDQYDDDDYYGRNRNRRRNNNSNLESLANNFKDATERLENEYDNRRDYNDSSDEVRRVLQIGQQLDREISRSRVSSSIRSDWNRIESDLRVLANAYNYSYDGSNNRNGRWGGIFDNFPF